METLKFKFEDLKVYQKAIDFIDYTYHVSNKFPSTERYGLTSQFTRAALSIALNIAEGSSDINLQFNRFLQLALDSLNECVVCATVARRLSYISSDEEHEIRSKLVEISKMITSLQKYLKKNTTH